MAKQKATRYANTVVRVLAEEFPADLSNQYVREIITDAVFRHMLNPNDATEIIVDDPSSASWRLKPDRQNPDRVRIAHMPANPEHINSERERRINVALAAISED
jgi:hypothetical protein